MKKSLNDAAELKRVIEQSHGCKASYRTAVAVQDRFEGKIVWDGSVLVFDVDHPDASICYAWTSPVGEANAVLGKPPVNSPLDAVRAAIVADRKSGRTS